MDSMVDEGFERLFVGREDELRELAEAYKRSERLVILHGLRGSGKTALAYAFALRSRDQFPGGVIHDHAFRAEGIRDIEERRLGQKLKQPTLLILDDFEELPRGADTALPAILERQPNLSLLLVSSEPLSEHHDCRRIALGGLGADEFSELLSRFIGDVDTESAERFYSLVKGSPLLANLAGGTVREGLFTLNDLWDALQGFEYPGIIDSQGRPISADEELPPAIITDVTNVSEDLLRQLRADPAEMRQLPPRKFEELIAELLHRLGYEVELTPASGDGGFDIYAAKRSDLGRFLYLVECKRYNPPTKVGVSVIRGLHGVVQAERATAGVIATTSFFTKPAREFQEELKHQMQLADYIVLQRWLSAV